MIVFNSSIDRSASTRRSFRRSMNKGLSVNARHFIVIYVAMLLSKPVVAGESDLPNLPTMPPEAAAQQAFNSGDRSFYTVPACYDRAELGSGKEIPRPTKPLVPCTYIMDPDRKKKLEPYVQYVLGYNQKMYWLRKKKK